MAGTDYYKLLGISKSADDDEIKKAYKKMVGFPLETGPTLSGHAKLLSTGIEASSRSQSGLRSVEQEIQGGVCSYLIDGSDQRSDSWRSYRFPKPLKY